MRSNADKPDVQDDTDRWDWVPVENRPDQRRVLGAITLAASCLTLGLLAGMLSAQRISTTFDRTASDVSQKKANTTKSSSEPNLALGGPSETTTQERAPRAPVVINKGSAKIVIEQPRARDVEQAEAKVKAVEGEPAKSQDTAPKVSADPPTMSMPQRQNLRRADPREEKASATPAKPRSVDRSFKDYRDLRNYALGK